MMGLLGGNPLLILSGLLAVGWFASTVFLMGKHKIDSYLAVREATRTTQIAERASCDEKFAVFVGQINGEADSEVAAGNEAAELVPLLKDRAQLIERCKTSPYCRTVLPAPMQPNNTTADRGGGE